MASFPAAASDLFSAQPNEPQPLLRRVCVYGFFGLLLVLGLYIYGDYGISWDEDLSRATGMVTLRYVGEVFFPKLVAYHQDGTYPPLSEWPNREYGVLFEAPACVLERLLHIEDVGARFRLRHLLTFLVCSGGVVAMYQLAKQRFADWRVGLLGAAWLVLSPRLFAESFYNSKDAVFMALFAVAMCTSVQMVLRPSLSRAAWHALACAAAIDVRVMAIILPCATLALLLLRATGGKVAWRTVWPVLGLYAAMLVLLIITFWPYLWAAPWTNFKLTFQHMSVYGWWDNTMLYRGQEVSARALPWHYAPVWIGITTPLLYLAALVVGLLAAGRLLLPRRWHYWAEEAPIQDLFFAALLVLPLLAVIVLKSVLYDGWRHLYFVYPALLLVALRGWVLVWYWLRSSRLPHSSAVLFGLTGLSMMGTAYQMVVAHPNQQVYFNWLAGPNAAREYELDYWGLSFRQGLEYILAHDNRPRITLKINDEVAPVAKSNRAMLPAAARPRFVFTETETEADYFLTNYRWHPGNYPYPQEVHRVMAGDLRILSVFKLK